MRSLVALGAILGVAASALAGGLSPQSEQAGEREISKLSTEIVAAVYAGLVRERAALDAIAATEGPHAAHAAALADRWDERLAEPAAGMGAVLQARDSDWGARSVALRQSARRSAIEMLSRETLVRAALERAERSAALEAPSPAPELTLSFHPTFAGDGLEQIEHGLTTPLRIDGSGNAEGLRLDAIVPKSWMLVRSYGDASVLRARSRAGEGLSSITLSVAPLPEDSRERGLDAVRTRATPEGVDRFHEGSTFIESGQAEALGQAALFATREERVTSRHGVVAGVVKEYLTVIGNNLVKIEAAVTDSGRPGAELLDLDTLRAEFDRVEPLFDELVRRWSPASSATP